MGRACGPRMIGCMCDCLMPAEGKQEELIKHLRVPQTALWWVRFLVNPLGIPSAVMVGCMVRLQIPLMCTWAGVSWPLLVHAYLGMYLALILLLIRCMCDRSENTEDLDEANLPRRVYWCTECRKYQDGYDHHNYWIGNCVMSSNERQ